MTGGTGFVGCNLLPILKEKDIEVLSLTTTHSAVQEKNIKWQVCNIFDDENLKKNVAEFKATHLLHLAWEISPGNYNLKSNFDWLQASMNLIRLFMENGGKRAVIVGSGLEYDWSAGLCRENETKLSDATLYGLTKNLLHRYCEALLKSNDISFAWPRLFFLYGPNEDKRRLIPYLITQLLKGDKAVVRETELYRDYLYVKDAVNYLATLLFSNYTGTINIASGEPTKLRDIALTIGNIIGNQNLIEFQNNSHTANKIVVADNKKMISEFGFSPRYSIENGLEETIKWWKNKQDL